MEILHLNPFIMTDKSSPYTTKWCQNIIEKAEALGLEAAPITVDPINQVFEMRPDVRNNTRVFIDDNDLAETLFIDLEEILPKTIDGWILKGLNERFRVYRYTQDQSFEAHYDAPYTRSDAEESKLTLIIYLNESYEGGSTDFFLERSEILSVKGTLGEVLIFEHDQLHSGSKVTKGIKYILRTDVMYEKVSK